MILGVHVSSAGKIYQSLDAAKALGCDTMQIFSRSPQTWRNGSYLKPEDIEEFKARRREFKIDPVFIHISYLINLASPDPRLYNASIRAYIEDIREADALGADYIVTHMGSHKDTSEDAGIKRLISALNKILDETKGAKAGILLENTSGSGSWLGYRFYHQHKILKGIEDKSRVGLCLDTAHAYLAGYDLSSRKGLEQMLDEIEEMAGLRMVRLIHLNDAAGELGCHHDRHDHIGKGHIGLAGMKRIITHPKLKGIPMILETPKSTRDSDKENLALVRRLGSK
ncbi:MAG: deoxyribonuclease IV [Candidatus Omnitrophica bacterium]|nr:deoxyribonuclease IV [Candidatus Omnitrophota bacterium]MDD5042198.1 deoxyribonuclease IV [Candidatus Omnitrophota bacterium]MDD5501315.1 deoxyribonuclease IV [Candidatus Omnitrophota bacterium]